MTRFYRKGDNPICDKTFLVETLGKTGFVKVGTITVTGKEVGIAMDTHHSIKGYQHCNIAKRKAETKFPNANPIILTEI